MNLSTFSALFLLLAFSVSLSAQSANEARAVKSTEKMTKRLDLSDEQQKTIKAAYLDMYRKITELRAQQEKSNLKAGRQTINDEFDQLLSNTLTDDQMAKWQQYEQERKTQPVAKAGPSKEAQEAQIQNAAAQKTKKMTKQLSLTEDQQVKVHQAIITKLTETRALRPMVKQDREATKRARKKIKTNYDTAIRNILTDEQINQKLVIEQRRKVKQTERKSNQKKDQD